MSIALSNRPSFLLRKIVAVGAVMLASCLLRGEPVPVQDRGQFTLGQTVVRSLPKTRPDRQYALFIGLPESFGKEPGRRYPVVIVTDGYWDFTTVVAMYRELHYDETLPEMVVVGVGYVGDHLDYESLRGDDLRPLASIGKTNEPGDGQAFQFLRMLETEAIPLLEREYHTDPHHRILMGCSAGGLFTLYAMYRNPALFSGYVAAAPQVAQIWSFEEEFAHTGTIVPGRLFMTAADYEWRDYDQNILLFNRRLLERHYLKGGYRFWNVAGMRHSGERFESYARGLEYVCEPIAPQTGPSTIHGLPGIGGSGRLYEVTFEQDLSASERMKYSEAQIEILKRHREWLESLVAETKVLKATRSAEGSDRDYSMMMLVASSEKEAAQIAESDPAVAAGLLRFKVLSLSP